MTLSFYDPGEAKVQSTPEWFGLFRSVEVQFERMLERGKETTTLGRLWWRSLLQLTTQMKKWFDKEAVKSLSRMLLRAEEGKKRPLHRRDSPASP